LPLERLSIWFLLCSGSIGSYSSMFFFVRLLLFDVFLRSVFTLTFPPVRGKEYRCFRSTLFACRFFFVPFLRSHFYNHISAYKRRRVY
jgi:hypothetical protein